MPNFLELLRLKNLFNPASMTPNMDGGFAESFPQKNPYGDIFQGGPKVGEQPASRMNWSMSDRKPVTDIPVESGMPMNNEQPEYDVAGRMSQMYKPETGASDRFSGLIDNMPKMEKPGILRSIAAALTAFGPGGHEMGMKVARQPYEDKMRDWKSQIDPAHQAASLERHSNVNERTLAYQTVSQELRQEAQEAKERNDERNATIREHRASIYEFKARNPNLKIVMNKGGNVMTMNPQTGEMQDTGIPSGSMSRIDELNLMQENAIERIGTTGGETRKTEEVRQGNRLEVVGKQGEESRKTKGTASGSTITSKAELPSQTKTRQYNSAAQLANSRPELSKFIKLGNGNTFTIIAPNPSGWSANSRGPTQQQYDEIVKSIYGEQAPIQQPGRTGATPPINTPASNVQAPVAPKGWKYVPKPGGGWTAVPDVK